MNQASDIHLLIPIADAEGGEHVIAGAAALWPGSVARIVNVWRTAETQLEMASPMAVGGIDFAELDQAIARDAQTAAERGAEYARSLGLDAAGQALGTDGPVWKRILEDADEQGIQAIVTGSRGRGDISSALLGSTSHALLHHSKVPVTVVPPGHPS
jgi:nucleotide-binding universal stress UspA family protein